MGGLGWVGRGCRGDVEEGMGDVECMDGGQGGAESGGGCLAGP